MFYIFGLENLSMFTEKGTQKKGICKKREMQKCENKEIEKSKS